MWQQSDEASTFGRPRRGASIMNTVSHVASFVPVVFILVIMMMIMMMMDGNDSYRSSNDHSTFDGGFGVSFTHAYTPTLTCTTSSSIQLRVSSSVSYPSSSSKLPMAVSSLQRIRFMRENNSNNNKKKNTLHSVIDAEVVLNQNDDDGDDETPTSNSNSNSNNNSKSNISRTKLHQLFHSTQLRIRQWMTTKKPSWGRNLSLWKHRYRSVLMTAAIAFTVLLKTSTLPIASTGTTTATATNVVPTTTAAEIMLASSSSSSSTSVTQIPNPMKDAALSYVHRGGTAATSTTTSTSATKILRKATANKVSSKTMNRMHPKNWLANSNNNKNYKNNQPQNEIVNEIRNMERVVEHGVVVASEQTSRTFVEALHDLHKYMTGPKSDTLLLLLATALITPLCQQVNLSPILGFLASGMIMGPNGFGVISGIHTTETLAELGIVFFLFEMGIELSFNRLKSMRRDVFGLGLAQFLTTASVVAGVGAMVGLPANANVVLGGGLALSSSAFVLQLLKDKNQLATRFGKASFGVLLFQDLAVVPLLVVTPILAGSGAGLATALTSALVKAAMALSSIAVAGRYLLNPLFKLVAQAQSQEAFLGVVLLTVLSMSFMTEGLGLSNTLGAFLAGVLLSETKYRYQVEADIAPFRGILLGLFFVTVGFEIDVKLIASNLPLVGSLVFGIMGIKAAITTALSLAFGLSLSTSQQTGLMLSQGGEFAFVAFGLARSLGILDKPTTKLMLTSVSLTMALTPLMSTLGSKIAKQLEEQSDATHYLGQDRDANEIKESDDFTVVVGYGIVGKVVCDLLDRKFLRYVGLEIDPNRAIQARNAGLPVFYGDIGRQEVAEAFNVGKANAVVVCIADKAQTNRVVIALRRWYPDLPIFARAVNADHAKRLQDTLNVAAMVPILPTDNILLTLPFGSAVMKSIGVPPEEVNAIVDTKRREIINMRGSNREEEELELLQLGISSETLKDTSGFTDSSDDDTLDEEERYDEQYEMTTEAAWERRKAIEEKSPFVARVIQEVCPESADDDDDDDDDDEDTKTVGANGANGEVNLSSDVTLDMEFALVNNNNRTIAVTAEQK